MLSAWVRPVERLGAAMLQQRIRSQRPSVRWFLQLLDGQLENVAFIQVGANDGVSGDPYAAYKRLSHWKGVLLEPQKGVIDTLRDNFPEPRYTVLNCAMGPRSETRTLYKVGFTDSRWATGLASFEKASLVAHFENGYVAREAAEEGVDHVKIEPRDGSYDHLIAEEPVESISFSDLIARRDHREYHALFIDTEGYDLEILKCVDLDQTALRLVAYEQHLLSPAQRNEAEQRLAAAGFTIFPLGTNAVAVRNLALPLLLRF